MPQTRTRREPGESSFGFFRQVLSTSYSPRTRRELDEPDSGCGFWEAFPDGDCQTGFREASGSDGRAPERALALAEGLRTWRPWQFFSDPQSALRERPWPAYFEHITFHDDENGFSVLLIAPRSRRELIAWSVTPRLASSSERHLANRWHPRPGALPWPDRVIVTCANHRRPRR